MTEATTEAMTEATTEAPTPVPYPFAEAVRLDLHPRYAELRERGTLLRVRVPYGDDAWLATRYEDVRTVLTDPRFSRAAASRHDEARLTPLAIRTSVMGVDPPDHTRLRKLVANAFSRRGVEHLRPRVTDLVRRLTDDMVARGSPSDLVTSFVTPLSGLVICELLGVPYEDRTRFRHWLEGFFSITALPADDVAARIEAMYDYIAELVARRRAEPADDLLGGLVRARDRDRSCSEQELVDLANVLLLAGYHTTAAQLASSLYVLLCQPEQAELLRSRPELMPSAVEELLRYVPLIAHVSFARYATEDVLVGGTLVRAGDAVLPAIPSANRDAEAFPDPDRLDLARRPNQHLAFGVGLHHCLGASLVRVQMEVALTMVLGRFPDLALAVPPDEVEWLRGMQARTPVRLPVVWGGRAAAAAGRRESAAAGADRGAG
ncbi:nocardicin N-oxygenase [Streptoalloteichus tenebrarius]|uniref:Nocardicin N-oxygenase n=1 Tax=Streptoalloteichus tenebrarius (strain ATCC 17920 / DSM 40477 / JCM 4838 / CBS 697.72 / NBRC 16177 / NCIMB 11028 / NRRL B-12390 / A12253. 1 / ISP 5477) TaxID=1933 RepID=A0ABT1HSP1_STRSD|nr:cytochrome P450 [Streptoalloteichus tenebrarius]MCP2258526.1 nocardicin N-oxygenase [Streptoalloteichus tenebrarius]BFF04111.1 cytochrome P450 [Streptoalloteichus tenebrarius]